MPENINIRSLVAPALNEMGGSIVGKTKGDKVIWAIVIIPSAAFLAVPRVWAALAETHRRPDGQITVPDILRPYLGGRDLLTAGPSR